ncbi:helix-turn-helix domain-containing protein, partial [Pseudomaricurvus sp.]|uniref:helix-turn-helix domain-containing protein n=1 Tax=Pseudomaricurvus sp. TaxID=2004510 RepID=UPI003F6D7BCB
MTTTVRKTTMVDDTEMLVDEHPGYQSPTKGYSGNQQTLASRLRRLHDLLTDRHESYQLHCNAYLEAGRRMFDADEALLLRLRFLQDEAVVEAHSGDKLANLDSVSSEVPWCSEIIEQKRVTFQSNSSVNSETVTYNEFVIRGYLCAPVFVTGQLFGVLCFLRGTTEKSGFTDEDTETIELMAKGVAKMIELQRVQPVDQEKLRAGFATEGVRTFEEYVQLARLPEVYGVPGRVVDVLQKRIGKCSLSIDFIAEEMNLSKRTLQRRLQQQNISFAQLRDQVRFHHAITYLVEQTMSIDSISASLDFSDRTSFT